MPTTAERLHAVTLLRNAVPTLSLRVASDVVDIAAEMLPDDHAVYKMLAPSTGKVQAHVITRVLTGQRP